MKPTQIITLSGSLLLGCPPPSPRETAGKTTREKAEAIVIKVEPNKEQTPIKIDCAEDILFESIAKLSLILEYRINPYQHHDKKEIGDEIDILLQRIHDLNQNIKTSNEEVIKKLAELLEQAKSDCQNWDPDKEWSTKAFKKQLRVDIEDLKKLEEGLYGSSDH